MYAEFFGLTQDPFSIAPDPRFLYLSERHSEALAHLLYGVQGSGGFVLLTGDIGTGKTTVCRRFLEQAPEHCELAYIFNPRLSAIELLRTVCDEFGIEVRHSGAGDATVKDHLDPLNAFLLEVHAAGRHAVLVIDEAQNLPADVLEQLRLLTNLETYERKLLQIVLIGQPELKQLLARPELEQLAQRVIARFHLDALSGTETRAYIQHRLRLAGLSGELPFSQRALARIHRLTGGVPRRINLLCGRALLGAYARGHRRIDTGVVNQAAREVFDSALPSARRSLGRSIWLALGGVALGGLLTAGAFWALPGLYPRAPAPAAQAAAAVATPVPTPPPPLPAPAAVPAGPVITPGEPGRADLLTSENAGWRELAALWGETLGAGEPCASAQRLGLQCFRTPRMTPEGLAGLDRPALLLLRLDDGARGWVMLQGLGADEALLRLGDKRWRLPLARLNTLWFGSYATLWRTPPGETGRVNQPPRASAARWLDEQLLALQREGALAPEAGKPLERLQAFQKTQGIAPDTQPTATTFMQANRARGVAEPRLSTPPP